MSVNLSKLNISLDSFNAAATGKYNIGQIKLNTDGSGVYRVNSHKTWTVFNKTEISMEEAVAVKEAFCRAISKEAGLDEAAVSDLKKKLGIDGGKLEAMKAGTMKALTAAEVREVIDAYADKINKGRAPKARLETGADLYKGVSQKTLTSRAEAREKVNAQTFGKIATKADSALNAVFDLVDYDGGTISPEMRKLAKGIFEKIQRTLKAGDVFKLKGSPVMMGVKDDLTFRALVTLDNGNSFAVDLGIKQDQLLAKLNKMMDVIVIDEKFDADLEKVNNELAQTDETGGVPKATTRTSQAKKKGKINPLDMSKEQVAEMRDTFLDSLRESFTMLKEIGGELKDIDYKLSGEQTKQKNRDKLPPALLKLQEYRGDDGGRLKKLVESLQTLLVAVRGHDPRNAKIVNCVRDAFFLDPHAPGENSAENDAQADKNALYDKLYDQISEVLNKERVSQRDSISGATGDQGKVDDDLPLNINQLAGVTDEEGKLVDQF